MSMHKMDVARGLKKADLVLKNGTVLNVFSEELIKCDVAIVDDEIVGLGDYSGIVELDCSHQYLVPGFIDAHMHVETTMVTPFEFSKSVIKKGTTTIIIDPHEIVNVCGSKGLDYMIEATENILVDCYIMMPSSVPALDIDVNGAGEFLAKDMIKYINHPRILGLGEVMRFNDVLSGDQRMLEKLQLYKDRICDGHAPGIKGKDIQGYRLAGIANDHECENGEDALEKLRAGLNVMVREGSGAKNLAPILSGLLKAKVSLDRCMFCTDDKHLEDIEHDGHINYCVKKAIDLGCPTIKAYKMASYNTAMAYNLKNVGAIGAGYKADILVIDQLNNPLPDKVIRHGQLVKSGYHRPNTQFDEAIFNTVKVKTITIDDLEVPRLATNPVIELVADSLLTKLNYETLPGNDFFEPNETYSKLCVVERHGKNGDISVCALKGYNITNGAIATTVSHDAHNIIVAGDNDLDIIRAIEELKNLQGGYVIVSNQKVVAELPLPIAGLMSMETNDEVQDKIQSMLKIASGLNIASDVDAFITLSFIALAVIPEVRLTTSGLYDVINNCYL